MFSRWGAFVYRFRRPVVLLTVVLAIASSVLAAQAAGALSSGGWLDADSESAEVAARLDEDFGSGKSSMIALFRSATAGADATSPEFQGAIADTTAGLADNPDVSGVIGYAETGDKRFISTAGDAAYVVIELTVTDEESVDAVDGIREDLIAPAGYSYQLTGYGPITKDGAEQSEKDLQKAEIVSLPIAALVLILVFASIVAAGMPLLVAGLAIPSTMALIFIVAQQVEMSIYVLNIATMLGLALAIDYSLFIVSRYREELRRGRTVGEAVERAVATSGKAVMFSGIAVAIGLSGLLLFEAPAIRSIGIAGSLVVISSVFFALTFLPAVLGMLGHRVNALSLSGHLQAVPARLGPAGRGPDVALGARRPVGHAPPDPGHDPDPGHPAHRRHPVRPHGPGRARRRCLPARRREPGRLRRAPDRVRAGRDHADRRPRRRRGVARPTSPPSRPSPSTRPSWTPSTAIDRVEGPFAISDPGHGRAPLAGAGRRAVRPRRRGPAGRARHPPRAVRARQHRPARRRSARSRRRRPAATDLIPVVRAVDPGEGITTQVGGAAAAGYDFLVSQAERAPYAVGLTLLASALILFLLFGSVIIPIKAVIMTLLSITASFGALVWIFQDGNLSNLLNFEPLGYTIAGNPIIMFSVIFGLSMDYEVLLLSRIQEAYRRTGENTMSVAEGLSKTAGVITGAALIMVSVFAAFALAEVITIKSIGVGMAIAVAVDATIIRVLLVPATMRLMGKWNWWAPGLLAGSSTGSASATSRTRRNRPSRRRLPAA